jgi:hypothetical protein
LTTPGNFATLWVRNFLKGLSKRLSKTQQDASNTQTPTQAKSP